jgi:transglutaminase-like putative cysteine protease
LIALRIRHRTTYAYRRPVSLGPHRLMLRSREGRDLGSISSEIKVSPEGALTWGQDVFGNAVATVTFSAVTDVLAIDAAAEVELHASAWPVFDIAASAIVYPFRYSEDEWTDLRSKPKPKRADGRRTWRR